MQSNWDMIKQLAWPSIPCEGVVGCTQTLGYYGLQAAIMSGVLSYAGKESIGIANMTIDMIIGTLYSPRLHKIPTSFYRPLKAISAQLYRFQQSLPRHRPTPKQALATNDVGDLKAAFHWHNKTFWNHKELDEISPLTLRLLRILSQTETSEMMEAWMLDTMDEIAAAQQLSSRCKALTSDEAGLLLTELRCWSRKNRKKVHQYLETRSQLRQALAGQKSTYQPFQFAAVMRSGAVMIMSAIFAISSLSTLFTKRYGSKEAFSTAFFGKTVAEAQGICAAQRTAAWIHNLGGLSTAFSYGHRLLFGTFYYLKPLTLATILGPEISREGWRKTARNITHILFSVALSDFMSSADQFHFLPTGINQSVGEAIQFSGLGTSLSASTVGLIAMLAPSIIQGTINTVREIQKAEESDTPPKQKDSLAMQLFIPLLSADMIGRNFGRATQQLLALFSQSPRCVLLSSW